MTQLKLPQLSRYFSDLITLSLFFSVSFMLSFFFICLHLSPSFPLSITLPPPPPALSPSLYIFLSLFMSPLNSLSIHLFYLSFFRSKFSSRILPSVLPLIPSSLFIPLSPHTPFPLVAFSLAKTLPVATINVRFACCNHNATPPAQPQEQLITRAKQTKPYGHVTNSQQVAQGRGTGVW